MTQLVRVLVAHNRYQQPGGEDVVAQHEISLLRANGHEVEVLEQDNDDIGGWVSAAATALRCVYSSSSARAMQQKLDQFKPDLVHIHNFFPSLSPSVHYACLRAKVPVVQTLHNYRLLCPSSTFLREEKICEDCMGKAIPWPSVQHACYRQGRFASAAVANMLFLHRACGTWTGTVKTFIALTEFGRRKFVEGGLPADRIVVKPNFVSSDPRMGGGAGGYALFVGRLSTEKGIDTLLAAWRQLSTKWPLKIVGDGPMAKTASDAALTTDGIEWLGSRNKEEVSQVMADAKVLILPSICYEGFALVIPEAYAAGLPVIASRLGAMTELVVDGETGLLFTPGRPEELASAVEWAFSHPVQIEAMRHRARREFEEKYTAESNYAILSDIYGTATRSVRPIC
jgi:glycosyltransferase involved in cell wall biosynthesis